jgi:hypothetical protein
MKRRFHLPVCPYCGRRSGYLESLALRKKGEFFCPKCGGLSNIEFDGIMYYFAFLIVLIAATFFCVGMAFGIRMILPALCGILITALVFLFVSPLFVRLRKPNQRQHTAGSQMLRDAPGGRQQKTGSTPDRE